MKDFHVLPADPRDIVRDRYRDFASQERPGDPWEDTFHVPTANEINLIWPIIWVLVVAIVVSGAVAG